MGNGDEEKKYFKKLLVPGHFKLLRGLGFCIMSLMDLYGWNVFFF